MKKLVFLLFVTGAIAGCGQAAKDSAEKADSTNQTKDSADKKHPASLGQEISGDDATFAVKAAAGGLTEVELGKLAVQKGGSQAVKDFGAMMVKDHSAANQELADLAKSKHIVLPEKLNDDGAKLRTELSEKSGRDFDKAYADAMVKDHAQDTTDFVRGIKVTKYPEMTAFAKKTLPILKMHLAAAEKIKKSYENK
jgi:putative membrane protein